MRFFSNLLKSSFVKDSSYMVLSTIAMQLIAISTIPILTRLFSPEVFGYHSTYRATLVILSIIFTLKLETAIVLPKLDENKRKIYLSSITNVIIIVVLLTIFYYSLRFLNFDILLKAFDISDFELFLLVLLGSLFVGFTNIDQSRLVSLKHFKTIAISRLILPLSFFFISILLFYFYNNYLSLIISQLITYFFLFLFFKNKVELNLKGFSKNIYFCTLSKYNDIIKYTSTNSLLNTISLNVPSLILLSLFGAKILGFYAIGAKLISLPSQFISASFSQVFYKKSVDIYNYKPEKLYPFVKKIMLTLLLIGVVTFTIAYFLVPYLVPLFLGSDWVGAIEIMQYICLWQALMIVNGPVSTLTILLNKQKELLIFNALLLIFRVFSIWYPFHLGFEAKYSILSFALVGLLFNSFLFFYFLNISKKSYTHK